jgi:hypothetical protein
MKSIRIERDVVLDWDVEIHMPDGSEDLCDLLRIGRRGGAEAGMAIVPTRPTVRVGSRTGMKTVASPSSCENSSV